MNRTLISISNHPFLPNVTRKVAILKAQHYYDYDSLPIELQKNNNDLLVKSNGSFERKISLDLLVLHYNEEGKYIKMGNNDGVVFISSDSTDYINPLTFEKVEKDENGNYPKGSLLEYDVLWDIVYTKKTKTDLELQEMFIALRTPNINEKLYS